MAAREKRTPVRAALLATSVLSTQVRDGLRALHGSDQNYLAKDIRRAFADSLALDAVLRHEYPEENRWDYLLGHGSPPAVVGLEPHSARGDQISTVIRKKEAARQQLAAHLRPGRRVSAWLWVASGDVQFADTEKARRRLDEHGIRFVGRQVLANHLP
jgi:hypothetical protein